MKHHKNLGDENKYLLPSIPVSPSERRLPVHDILDILPGLFYALYAYPSFVSTFLTSRSSSVVESSPSIHGYAEAPGSKPSFYT
jgi:hypothetical protein